MSTHLARNGWKYLLGMVVIIGLFGIGDIVRGLDADPAIPEGITGLTPDEIRAEHSPVDRLADLQVRSGGIHLLIMAALWSVLLVVPFRRRERWAWTAMWTFPAWALAVAVSFLFIDLQPDAPVPPPAISGWVFFALAALLLTAASRGFRSEPASVPPSKVAGQQAGRR